MANWIWLLSLRRIQNSKKQVQMKKVFAILAVAGFMASCNSGAADAEKAAADSTKAADSTAKATAAADSTAKAAMDTTKAADTTKPKM